jgi:hypothetical protein
VFHDLLSSFRHDQMGAAYRGVRMLQTRSKFRQACMHTVAMKEPALVLGTTAKYRMLQGTRVSNSSRACAPTQTWILLASFSCGHRAVEREFPSAPQGATWPQPST